MINCPCPAARIERFIASHPHADGWTIYDCGGSPAERLALYRLPDWIRDTCPHILKRRQVLCIPRDVDRLVGRGDVDRVEINSERTPSEEVDAEAWYGRLEIEWQGQPIHYYAFETSAETARVRVLIATRSNAAMRKLHEALEAYDRKREKERYKGWIYVVNGDDIRVPEISWDDVILPGAMARELRSDVESFFRNKETYRELGIPFRRGFLFAGPPGCGKTLTLKALANSIGASFVTVLAVENVDEGDIEHALYRGKYLSPAVVIFEDLDRLVQARRVSISRLLNLLDEITATDGVLIVATSNYPEKLDPALLHRPSRLDRFWRFPLPDAGQRLSILRRKGASHFSAQALEDVARASAGFSMASVQEIVVNALLGWVHDAGRGSKDDCLRRSLEALRLQRRNASQAAEDMSDRGNIGFLAVGSGSPNGRPAEGAAAPGGMDGGSADRP